MNKSRDELSPSCSSAEELVTYLYGEMRTAEQAVFEEHLSVCDVCTAEFAELSLARLGVYEWNRDEFAELATPRIVVPYGEPARTSWIDAARAFFASHAQIASVAGAFTVLAIAAGVWLVVPANKDIATGPKAASSPIAIANKPPEVKPVIAVSSGSDTISKPTEPREPQDVRTPGPGIVKPAAERNVRNPNSRPAKPEKATPPPVQAKRPAAAPRLNDFEEEDDDTLRLGDLLAEVDTRD